MSNKLLSLFICLATAGAAPFDIQVQRLSPRAAVFHGGPWGNAIVAVATQKGIVVVDAPFSPSVSRAFREAIQAEFKRSDFARLLVTHEHSDHAGGNAAFADVPIVGHASLRAEMLRAASDPKIQARLRALPEQDVEGARKYLLKHDPKRLESPEFAAYQAAWKLVQDDYRNGLEITPPTVTFDREMSLYLGDVTARLRYYGHAHSVSDAIVSFPEENLVVTGALFQAGQLPTLPAARALAEAYSPQVVENWLSVLRDLLDAADENTKFIAGHRRDAMKKAQIEQFRGYLDKLWSKVRRERAEGKTLEQAYSDLALATHFPELAGLKNESGRDTPYEVLNIHQRNIEFLWKAVGIQQ